MQTMIRKRKAGVVHTPLLAEQKLEVWRTKLREVRKAGLDTHRPRDREHNAKALRTVWPIYAEASMHQELMQRIFLAQVGLRVGIITEVLTKQAERIEMHLKINKVLTHYPRSLQRSLTIPRRLAPAVDADAAETHLLATKEFCEGVAQEAHKTVILTIHDADLLRRLHAGVKPDLRRSMFTVNLDKNYTWPQRGQPTWFRSAMTAQANGFSMASIQERVNSYCDSMRLLGENVETYGCVYDKPPLNVLLCLMAEYNLMADLASGILLKINRGIMQETAKLMGVQFVETGLPILKDARSFRYAAGVIVTNGVSNTSLREVNTLNVENCEKFIREQRANVDVPRLLFHVRALPLPATKRPDYGPLWDMGVRKLSRSLNPMTTQLDKVMARVAKKQQVCGKNTS